MGDREGLPSVHTGFPHGISGLSSLLPADRVGLQ